MSEDGSGADARSDHKQHGEAMSEDGSDTPKRARRAPANVADARSDHKQHGEAMSKDASGARGLTRRELLALGVPGVIVVLAACGTTSAGNESLSRSKLPGTDGLAPAISPTTIPVSASPVTTSTTLAPPTTLPPTSAPPPTAPPSTLPNPDPIPTDSYAPEADIVLGRIAIPRIKLDTEFREGVTLTTLDKGPGHWPGTAAPGQIGNVVVAGHRVTHSKPFRNIDKIQPGDLMTFTMSDGSVFDYAATSSEAVDDEAVWIVNQTPEPTATIFACHPPGSARQRFVVYFVLQ